MRTLKDIKDNFEEELVSVDLFISLLRDEGKKHLKRIKDDMNTIMKTPRENRQDDYRKIMRYLEGQEIWIKYFFNIK